MINAQQGAAKEPGVEFRSANGTLKRTTNCAQKANQAGEATPLPKVLLLSPLWMGQDGL